MADGKTVPLIPLEYPQGRFNLRARLDSAATEMAELPLTPANRAVLNMSLHVVAHLAKKGELQDILSFLEARLAGHENCQVGDCKVQEQPEDGGLEAFARATSGQTGC